MSLEQMLAKYEKLVVRAAEAWIDFEDTGTISDLRKETGLRERLSGAVTRLQRARRRIPKRGAA